MTIADNTPEIFGKSGFVSYTRGGGLLPVTPRLVERAALYARGRVAFDSRQFGELVDRTTAHDEFPEGQG